jgi:hypothetical protein
MRMRERCSIKVFARCCQQLAKDGKRLDYGVMLKFENDGTGARSAAGVQSVPACLVDHVLQWLAGCESASVLKDHLISALRQVLCITHRDVRRQDHIW